MTCKNCPSPIENNETGLCAKCGRESRKQSKPKKSHKIKPVSDKQRGRLAKYKKARKEFLERPENAKCRVSGLKADSVHHMKGKVGDLLFDTRYFLPINSFQIWPPFGCSPHTYVEQNPEWAKANGFSLDRLG